MSKEITSLTGIRGIAALWVVCYHVIPIQGGNIVGDVIKEFFSKGYLAVDIFFLLSATVMCMAYEKTFSQGVSFGIYKEYMLKRFIRIYPAYIFWEIIYNIFVRNFRFFTIIINVLLLQNLFDKELYTISIVLWSLSVEWMIYFIFPFMLKFFISANNVYILVATVILGFVALYLLPDWSNYYLNSNGLVPYKPTGNHSVVKGTSSVLRCLLCYAIGIAGFFVSKNLSIKNFFRSGLTYYIILALFILALLPDTNIFVVFISWLLILSLKERGQMKSFFNNNVVYFLGKISYSLYIVHMLILVSLSIIIKKVMGGDFMNNYHDWIVIATLTLLIPISYVSFIFIEQKGGNFLRKLLLKTQPVRISAEQTK